MARMQEIYQGARQANRSGGLVAMASDTSLAAAFVFWAWILWGFVRPEFNTSIEGMITGALLVALTITLALCCALVMPALAAAIFPHTAAAQYLQEIRRSAWGFWLLAASFGLLAFFSLYVQWNWWIARTGIPQPDGSLLIDRTLAGALTAMTFVFFVVVPSWATNYGAPVLWLTEVQQAHQVERLKLVHTQQLAIAKASYRRALAIIRAGLDSATVEQRGYVADVLIGMHQAEHSLMRNIAETLDTDAQLEQALPTYDDPAIVDNYGQLRQLLISGTPVLRNDSPDQASPSLETPIAPPRSAAQRRAAPQYEREYKAAFERLQPFITARQLAELLHIEDRTARDVLAAWEQDGYITKGNIRGQWAWVEEVRHG